MPHSGYTVSSASIGYMSGNSATTSGNNGVFQLIITPDVGFVVAATDFAIGDPFDSTKIYSVTFADSQHGAYHAQNFVVVTVTMQATYIVSANETIYIDIDGKADGIVSHSNVDICLKSYIQSEANCPISYWPASGSPISPGMTDPPGNLCSGCFIETEDGSGVTSTVLANATNWQNPLFNTAGYSGSITSIDTAEVNQYEAVHNPLSPGTPTVLFTKTFWTPPKVDFEVTPFYELNSAAAASGDYIVEESQDNYNVDKTLLYAINNTHIIPVDTSDVLPGMQVTGSTLTTCSYDPVTNPTPANICWPGWGMDIRVTKVDTVNNVVHLSESISSLSVGDILNFSTISYVDYGINTSTGNNLIAGGRVVAKRFIVKYNGSSDVPCGNHNINFAHYPRPLANISAMDGPNPVLSYTNLNTDKLNYNGDVRGIRIEGTPNLGTFSINITRSSDFQSYDFTEDKFTTGASDLIDQTLNGYGLYTKDIIFPGIESDDTYTITITPKTVENKSYLSTTINSGVVSTFTIYQYTAKTLTLTSSGTGLTLASGLTGITLSGTTNDLRKAKTPKWTGTITKADGSVLYINRQPHKCQDNGDIITEQAGDFNFNTTSTTDGKSNETSLILSPSITGAGTATLTATITGTIKKLGTANTTVTFDVDNFVTVRPSAPDVGGGTRDEVLENSGDGGNPKEGAGSALNVSITDGFLDIDVRSFDNDTNASSKTLSTVTAPKKGSLSAYGASGSEWDNGRIRYNIDGGRVSKPGETDQFVYKATVSGVDSDASGQGTITVTFTK